jgi:hypothetical protein
MEIQDPMDSHDPKHDEARISILLRISIVTNCERDSKEIE